MSNGEMNKRLLHSLFTHFTHHLMSLKTPIVHSNNNYILSVGKFPVQAIWGLLDPLLFAHYTVENIWKSRRNGRSVSRTHSGKCVQGAPHCYITPYLQSADHTQFQIPNVNYPHYHNHLDTHTARQQGSWPPVHKAGHRRAHHLDWFSGRITPLTAVKCVSEYIILIPQLCWPRSAESSPHVHYVQHFKWLLLTFLFSVPVRD